MKKTEKDDQNLATIIVMTSERKLNNVKILFGKISLPNFTKIYLEINSWLNQKHGKSQFKLTNYM